MKINLNDVLGSVGASVSEEQGFDIEEIKIQSRKIKFPHHPFVRVIVTNTEEDILVQGSVTGEAQLSCTRCLRPINWPISREFTETYSKDELNLAENKILDISEEIYQHLVLSIPMQTICSNNCMGICPGCGQDLNKVECQCDEEVIDPRWEKLRQYLKN